VGGALEDAVSGAPGRLQGLQRENGRLQDRLRGSEELNASLRSELDLHRSIMAQTSSHHQEQDQDQDQDQDHDGSGPQTPFQKRDEDIVSQKNAAEQPRAVTSGKHVTSSVRLSIYNTHDTTIAKKKNPFMQL